MIKNIYHLDCGSFCPHLADKLFGVDHFCCHCLLIECSKNLILVDTGLSDLYLQQNSDFFKKFINNPRFDSIQSAVSQVLKLGFKPDDITDIIATHVDQDHVGGLLDFKNATIHIHQNEETYLQPSYHDKVKRFSNIYFKNAKNIKTYDLFGELWNGFQATRNLENINEEIYLVPLVGHTLGHSGVAIQNSEGWLLHAGDAYFIKEDLNVDILHKNFKSELFQSVLAEHNKNRIENQKRLSQLKENHPSIQIINSHDPRYF